MACLIRHRARGRDAKEDRWQWVHWEIGETGDLLGQLPFASTINKYFNSNLIFISIQVDFDFNCHSLAVPSGTNKCREKCQDSSGRLNCCRCCCRCSLRAYSWYFSSSAFPLGSLNVAHVDAIATNFKCSRKKQLKLFPVLVCNFYSTPGDTIRAIDEPLPLAFSLHRNWSCCPRLCLCLCLWLMIINFIWLFL